MRKHILAGWATLAMIASPVWAATNTEDWVTANGYVSGTGLQEQPNGFWDGAGSTPTAGILDVVDYIPNGTDFATKLTVKTASGTAGANGRTDLSGGDSWGGPSRGVSNGKLYWSVDIQKGTGTTPGSSNIWQMSFIRGTGTETFFALYGATDSVGAKVWTGTGSSSAGAPNTLPTHALADNWNRVCVINDPIASTSEFQMFLNGTLVDTFDVLTNTAGNLTGIPLLRAGAGILVDQVIVERLNRGANEAGWDATMGFDNITTANEALSCGQPAPTALVSAPEPATVALLGIGGLTLLRRRRAA